MCTLHTILSHRLCSALCTVMQQIHAQLYAPPMLHTQCSIHILSNLSGRGQMFRTMKIEGSWTAVYGHQRGYFTVLSHIRSTAGFLFLQAMLFEQYLPAHLLLAMIQTLSCCLPGSGGLPAMQRRSTRRGTVLHLGPAPGPHASVRERHQLCAARGGTAEAARAARPGPARLHAAAAALEGSRPLQG